MEAYGMLFCRDCNNFLFLKNVRDEDGKATHMINYCKKCGFTYTDDRTGKKILHDVTYNSDATSKYLYNDYLKYDPTIPHLKSMYCVNPNCASNLPCKLSITFKYYPDGTGNLSVPKNLEQELTLELNNELGDDARVHGLLVKSISSNTYYVILTKTYEDGSDSNVMDEEDVIDIGGAGGGGKDDNDSAVVKNKKNNSKYMKIMERVSEYLRTKTMDREHTTTSGEQTVLKQVPRFTNVEEIKDNSNEILFIKHDTINMKFLYKCCVCSTSWKNKE